MKKGFTLIELLAVIIILVMLSLIIIPLVSENILSAKKYASDNQIKLIEEASHIYYINYLTNEQIIQISIQQILDKGLLKDKDLFVGDKKTINNTDKAIIVKINDEIKAIYNPKQDSNPIIILMGPENLKITKGTTYDELGAYVITYSPLAITALSYSNIDSNLNVNEEGTYEITYTYNNIKKIRTIEVESNVNYDNVKPIITLTGSQEVTLTQGSNYVEQGATATDDKDGNITSRIIIKQDINTNIKGTYYVKYDVVDSSGNKADTKIRVVIVN